MSQAAPVDIKAIIVRALREPAFRERLVANPKAIIEQELRISIPPDVTVHVHEQDDKVWHIVLPKPSSSAELTDAELEAVAGGAETVHLYLKSHL